MRSHEVVRLKSSYQTLRIMARLIRAGGTNPRVRAFALEALHEAHVAPRDVARMVRALHAVARDTYYVWDPWDAEWLQKVDPQLDDIAAGREGLDCDDKVILLASLCRAVGIPAYIKAVKIDTRNPDPFDHVYVWVMDPRTGEGVPCDPTKGDSQPGWEPPHRSWQIIDPRDGRVVDRGRGPTPPTRGPDGRGRGRGPVSGSLSPRRAMRRGLKVVAVDPIPYRRLAGPRLGGRPRGVGYVYDWAAGARGRLAVPEACVGYTSAAQLEADARALHAAGGLTEGQSLSRACKARAAGVELAQLRIDDGQLIQYQREVRDLVRELLTYPEPLAAIMASWQPTIDYHLERLEDKQSQMAVVAEVAEWTGRALSALGPFTGGITEVLAILVQLGSLAYQMRQSASILKGSGVTALKNYGAAMDSYATIFDEIDRTVKMADGEWVNAQGNRDMIAAALGAPVAAPGPFAPARVPAAPAAEPTGAGLMAAAAALAVMASGVM